VKDIERWLAEHRIDEVEGVVSDMAGIARGKFVPAQKFCRQDGIRLPESLFIQTVTGQHADTEMLSDADQDVILRPDESAMCVVPWAAEPTAVIIHDCFFHDGAPVDIAPRHVLRKVLKRYEEKGLRPVVAPEVEFYLVKPNTDADFPLEPPIGRSGRQEGARQPFSIDALNEFDPLIETVYDYCEAMGVGVDTLIHEAGAAQIEINFLHGDPLALADQVFLFKRIVREAAVRHNVYATFMAKPMQREPGSALHLHQSVVDARTGRNIFVDEQGEDTAEFLAFIAGLQQYTPDCVLIYAPYVNSYRRFARYQSAPINLHWGVDNRSVGLRVPRSGPESRRVENRVAGADVNPYIAIATSLMSGLLGMEQGLRPSEPLVGSAYDRPYVFPRDLATAVDRLRQCTVIKEALGERFIELYAAVKETEHQAYFEVISAWEREYLLLNV
jgi:glutamine synthetase